jgi:hypothetical protein
MDDGSDKKLSEIFINWYLGGRVRANKVKEVAGQKGVKVMNIPGLDN